MLNKPNKTANQTKQNENHDRERRDTCWKLAATCTRHRPSEADVTRERKLHLRDRFKISKDRTWNMDETAVRSVPSGERGWTKKAEPANVFTSRAFLTVTLAANMRDGMWTQIVHEE